MLGPKNTMNEDTLRSERRSARKKRLTESALLEMYGYACQLKRSMQHHAVRKSLGNSTLAWLSTALLIVTSVGYPGTIPLFPF